MSRLATFVGRPRSTPNARTTGGRAQRALAGSVTLGLTVLLAGAGILATGTVAQAADQLQESLLRNSVKDTYLTVKPFGVNQVWQDNDPTGSIVSYPKPGTTGVVSIAGTCVPSTATPNGLGGFFAVFPVGSVSSCLRFKALVTSENTFTLQVDDPRSSANGNYLGDGDRGGVLDLLSTSPLMQFEIPFVESPSINVVASGTVTDVDGDGRPSVGDRVKYQASVTNTGNASLSNVEIAAQPDGVVFSCPPAPLAPQGVAQCASDTGHILTQADIDSGTFTVSVSANAISPAGTRVTAPTTVTTPLETSSGIGVVKAGVLVDANHNGRADAGEKADYTITVTNSGGLTLTGVTVTDDLLGAIACPVGPLAPGATVTCDTVSIALTQAQIDAGSLTGTATATGTDPAGTTVTATSAHTLALDATQSVAVAKTGVLVDANGNGYAEAGEKVNYSITVTNTGGLTLTGVAVTDDLLGAIGCPAAPLAPGATITCEVTSLTLTQAQIDAGTLTGTATATGSDPAGKPVTDTSDNTLKLTTAPAAMRLTLTATLKDANSNDLGDAGEKISYTYEVANTGGTTLKNLTVTDSHNAVVTCGSATVAVNQVITCTAPDYTITAKDAEDRRVVNTAKAVTTTVANSTLTATADATTATTVPAAGPAAQVLAFTGSDITPLLVTVLTLLALAATTLTIRAKFTR